MRAGLPKPRPPRFATARSLVHGAQPNTSDQDCQTEPPPKGYSGEETSKNQVEHMNLGATDSLLEVEKQLQLLTEKINEAPQEPVLPSSHEETGNDLREILITSDTQPEEPKAAEVLSTMHARNLRVIRDGEELPLTHQEVFMNWLMAPRHLYGAKVLYLDDYGKSGLGVSHRQLLVEGEVHTDEEEELPRGWSVRFRLPPAIRGSTWRVHVYRAEAWTQNLVHTRMVFLQPVVRQARDDSEEKYTGTGATVTTILLHAAETGKPWFPRPSNQVKLDLRFYMYAEKDEVPLSPA